MLFGYINKEIADRIKESKEWVNRIDKIMARAKTNSGKRYSLKWTPKNVGFGMTGERLYQSILNVNNPSERGKESESLIKEYFYKKTKLKFFVESNRIFGKQTFIHNCNIIYITLK